MKFTILTIFPDMFTSFLTTSILGRAIQEQKVAISIINIRDYAKNKHKRVDDKPYGGGVGMLMTCQPLYDCLQAVKKNIANKSLIIYLTPQGKKLTQIKIEKLASCYDEIVLLCGHYEGIDQRIRDSLIDAEISIGDYILTGGEIPACVLIDAVSRLLPGVLNKSLSTEQESFSKALNRKKEYPQYTRPAVFKGMAVPDILLSGHEAKIKKWQKNNLK